jgi:hypothetical protein
MVVLSLLSVVVEDVRWSRQSLSVSVDIKGALGSILSKDIRGDTGAGPAIEEVLAVA